MSEYGQKLDEMSDAIHAALPEGEKMYVSYSAYKTSKTTDNPLNNLKQVAVSGKVMVIQEHDEFWGEGKTYQSKVLENPTWLDLAVVANEMIQVTGDYHHIFLEAVAPRKTKTPRGVKIYKFVMGS